MRFATFIFTCLASFALLLLSVEAGEVNLSTSRVEPFFSVFDAAWIGIGLWLLSATLVFRFPKASAVLCVLAGAGMLAFGFLDFGAWHGIFVFGVISFGLAAMAWTSWLVQVLWTDGSRQNDLGRIDAKQEFARG